MRWCSRVLVCVLGGGLTQEFTNSKYKLINTLKSCILVLHIYITVYLCFELLTIFLCKVLPKFLTL